MKKSLPNNVVLVSGRSWAGKTFIAQKPWFIYLFVQNPPEIHTLKDKIVRSWKETVIIDEFDKLSLEDQEELMNFMEENSKIHFILTMQLVESLANTYRV